MSPLVHIFVMMNRIRMNADFGPHWQMQPIRRGNAIFGNNFLENTSTNKAPKTHAFAQAAVEAHHASECLLGPDAAFMVELCLDFVADRGEVRWCEGTGCQVEEKVRGSDDGGLDGSKADHIETTCDEVDAAL